MRPDVVAGFLPGRPGAIPVFVDPIVPTFFCVPNFRSSDQVGRPIRARFVERRLESASATRVLRGRTRRLRSPFGGEAERYIGVLAVERIAILLLS